MTAELALFVLGVAAAATALGVGDAPITSIVILMAMTLLPGGAIISLLPRSDALSSTALAVALSLSIWALVSTFALWLHAFKPVSTGWAILGISGIVLLVSMVREFRLTGVLPVGCIARPTFSGRTRMDAIWLLPLLVGLALWGISISQFNINQMTDYGLPSVTPWSWFVGLGVVVVGTAVVGSLRSTSRAVCFLYVVGTVVVIYATSPLLSSDPQYAWTYKHIGVVHLLESLGHVDTSVDIYNRWPGFFAASATALRMTAANATELAKWAELYFAGLQVLMVAAIAQRVSRRAGIATLASLAFLLTNWIGQTYFSPQAFAFTLSLAVILVIVWQLPGEPNLFGRWMLKLTGPLARNRLQPRVGFQPSWSPTVAIAVVLLLDAAIVVSHQLTPYTLILQIGALAFFGWTRPWWTVTIMGLFTLVMLVPNLGFVNHNFGIFSSFDPFRNAQHSSIYITDPMAGYAFSSRAGFILSASMWLGALASIVVLMRRGKAPTALLLAALAFAPFALVFGQNYGGEASLRLVLFSSPFCAVLLAMACFELRPKFRAALAGPLALACSAMFIFAFYGHFEVNQMPSDVIRAAEYFYEKAEPHSVLMLAGPNFPNRIGARYPLFSGPKTDDDPNLLRYDFYRNRKLGPRDVDDVIANAKQFSQVAYLAFSSPQTSFAETFRLTPPGELRNLEVAVAKSPEFEPWFVSKDARIYKLRSGEAR